MSYMLNLIRLYYDVISMDSIGNPIQDYNCGRFKKLNLSSMGELPQSIKQELIAQAKPGDRRIMGEFVDLDHDGHYYITGEQIYEAIKKGCESIEVNEERIHWLSMLSKYDIKNHYNDTYLMSIYDLW